MNKLRILPLGGGPGMITNNLYLYEWGKEALIVDCGIGFPEDKVSDDILIPDIQYLKDHPKNIQAILLSHGHDDHIAALPHILPELSFPQVFASRLTAGFAQDRLKDFGVKHKIQVFKETDQLKLGPFTINPIHVTHSVPDAYHFVINTPVGTIYHASDYKFDPMPLDNRPSNLTKIAQLSQKGVLCLLSDCLRSERPGFTPSETTLTQAIHREITYCPGRLIFTTMSSQIHRIQQAVDVGLAHGRKIAFIGRSMERNTQTAARLGFLKLPRKSILNKHQIKKTPDGKLCLIVAGSQGQETSSLTRYAYATNKIIKPKPTDKVIYSTDIIPGNEQAVYKVVDELNRLGVTVVYQETADDLHVSGHASAGEIQLLMQLVKPQYLYPIGGSFRHMRQYQHLAQQIGFRRHQLILPQSAQVVEFTSDGHSHLAEKLNLKEIRLDQNQL
jgi:ribonuclease J